MQKHNLNELVDFNEERFNPKTVIHQPGQRATLISISAGHVIPGHAAPGNVTIRALEGYVTFFEDEISCELHSGEMVILEPASKHRLEAHEDSVLLVTLITSQEAVGVSADKTENLDTREVPRPLRHPMIFAACVDACPATGSEMVPRHPGSEATE